MVGSIDPRCETLRGTHWPKKGRLVVWNSRRGSHLGQRSTDRINRPDIWMQAIRSDLQKPLVARGPSTYGSPRSRGRPVERLRFASHRRRDAVAAGIDAVCFQRAAVLLGRADDDDLGAGLELGLVV